MAKKFSEAYLPEEPNGPTEPSKTRIGYRLAIFILIIISSFLVFIIVYLSFNLTDASSSLTVSEKNLSDSLAFNRNVELLKIVQSESDKKRDFIYKICQLVLLNLLLPTLTAILGYIFGSTKETDSGNSTGE